MYDKDINKKEIGDHSINKISNNTSIPVHLYIGSVCACVCLSSRIRVIPFAVNAAVIPVHQSLHHQYTSHTSRCHHHATTVNISAHETTPLAAVYKESPPLAAVYKESPPLAAV